MFQSVVRDIQRVQPQLKLLEAFMPAAATQHPLLAFKSPGFLLKLIRPEERVSPLGQSFFNGFELEQEAWRFERKQCRGVLDEQEAKGMGREHFNLEAPFCLSGLGQLAEAALTADRFVQF
jgi:hypothetical protein